MSAFKVGLTGGIGSGKSSVGKALRRYGLPVIDADQLARDVCAVGEPALQEIANTFGADVLLPDGALNRAELGRRVFSDAPSLARLNAIVHPRVRQRFGELVAELEQAGARLVFYEVPLLYETELEKSLDAVVVVWATHAQQLQRTAQRDGLTAADVELRVARQLPLQQKVDMADYVIDNSGEPADTDAQVDAALQAICERFGLALPSPSRRAT